MGEWEIVLWWKSPVEVGPPAAYSVGGAPVSTYRYDEDCWLPPLYPGWFCPFGHLNYQIHCWGCRY